MEAFTCQLSLKPIKELQSSDADAVFKELDRFIAYHPCATVPWRFYEIIDQWLGPWGEKGYPIGYGKFYCILFNEDQTLNADPDARKWIRNTTVNLQESILTYLVQRIREGSIGTITESQLRKVAFDSHPKCYDDAGLAFVAMLSPKLIPFISIIPKKEFDPRSPDIAATLKQVGHSAALTLRAAAFTTMSFIIPGEEPVALSQFIGNESYQFGERETTMKILLGLRDKIINRKIDGIESLKRVIVLIEGLSFKNLESVESLAIGIIQQAKARIAEIETQNATLLLKAHPDIRQKIKKI